MARGLRNNNPLNLRLSKRGDTFTGEVKPSQDGCFRQFETMAYGYRAVFRQLELYNKRGINTMEKIIKAWAPENENPTEFYVLMVASRCGVAKDKILTLNDGADYIKIVAAMSFFENGTPAEMNDVEAGFALQTGITRI